VDSFVAGELPLFILGWFPDFVDPDTWLTPFASCLQSPDNGVNYCNDQMDDLLARARAATDENERTEIYAELGEFYAEEVPTLPLFFEPEFITNRPGIEGITIGPPFEFNYNILSFTDEAQPASGSTDTIIIGTTDEVNSLDPNDAYATHDWEILKNTGMTLMKYTPGTADLVPGAAVEAPTISEDGLTYTFTLQEGLMFADGTAITAQDYVRSWDRLNALEGQVSGLLQVYIDSVEAPDDQTVLYHLKAPTAFFPALTATAPFVPVNPENYVENEITAFPDAIDGAGPYRMASNVPGEQLVLEANPNYPGDDKPIIPNVIIRYYADPTTMANAVENGEIDIAWRTVGPVEATRLATVEGLTVTTIDAPTLRYLVFNHTWTP
jgi:peptide/nickel transport system substrate-binding protein